MGLLIAAIVFVPRSLPCHRRVVALVAASDRLPPLLFFLPLSLLAGDDCLNAVANANLGTLMSMEPVLAALSGMVFLGEMLTLAKPCARCHHYGVHVDQHSPRGRETKIEKVVIKLIYVIMHSAYHYA